MTYLDNAATTMVCLEAINALNRALDDFGNPSSPYKLGVYAKNNLNMSQKKIEQIMGVNEGTFFFTSGATESNNWAIKGAAMASQKRGKHIISVRTEHPSVLEPLESLKKDGYEISYVNVDNSGLINDDELCGLIRKDTVVVSIMHVNNETGTINDISHIAHVIKNINNNIIFHTDCVSSFCKIAVNLTDVDLASVSGHKIHSPKGIGGLYIKKGTPIRPIILGGGQQSGMRSGTENTPYITAFAASVEVCASDINSSMQKIRELKDLLINGLSAYSFAEIIGSVSKNNSSPYILTVGFKGYKSQIIINALEERNIFVSAGSACSSSKNMKNKSLSALGVNDELIDSAVRFSFSKYSTKNDVNTVLDALDNIFKKYRGLL